MNSPTFARTVIAIGLPLAVVATLILAIGYAQEQQILRNGANEPQVWMAESIAARLSAGAPLNSFIPTVPVVLETDQSPYILIYDGQGKPVAGNATLNGTLPSIPLGVFGGQGEEALDNRVSWQPARGIRQAIVVTPFRNASTNGYVVVGRSLRETEVRESTHFIHFVLGWFFTMFVILVTSIISAWLLARRKT